MNLPSKLVVGLIAVGSVMPVAAARQQPTQGAMPAATA